METRLRALGIFMSLAVCGAAPGWAAPAPKGAKAARPAGPALTPEQQRQAMDELAELYAQEGRTDESLALFAELRALAPDEGKYWRRAADLLETLPERHLDLLVLLQGWRAAQPGMREPSERLVRFYEQDGAIDEGLKIIEQLLRDTPKDLAMLRLKAELLETGDRRGAAISAWSAVLALPGATPEDRWHRAELMSTQGDSPPLRAEYERLVAERPKDVRFRVAYGEALLAANELDAASAQASAAAGLAVEADRPGVAKLVADIEAARKDTQTDGRTDATERRDDLRRQADRATRSRALQPGGDY